MKTSTYSAILVILAAVIFFSWNGQANAADQPAQIEILYMNHGPLRPIIADIKSLLKGYQGKIQASWYDVNQPTGKEFMKKHKLQGHIPLLMLLGGESDFIIDGREVRLQGFPSGAGPFKQVEGNWSMDDLHVLFDRQVAGQQAR